MRVPRATLATSEHVNYRRLVNVGINLDSTDKAAILAELHRCYLSLRCLDVRASDSSDLDLLNAAIVLVEALRTRTCARSQLFVGLELPVGPASVDVRIYLVSDLSDLAAAFFCVLARAELAEDERHAEALGILSPLVDHLLVPRGAIICEFLRRLSS